MYTKEKVTGQTWKEEEEQNEFICLLDPLPTTNIISIGRQKGENQGDLKTKVYKIPPASEQKE